jgi:energy-coupling factor transporter ATP-binding protein EcfA2
MNLVLHYAEDVVVMENGEVAFHSAHRVSSLVKDL